MLRKYKSGVEKRKKNKHKLCTGNKSNLTIFNVWIQRTNIIFDSSSNNYLEDQDESTSDIDKISIDIPETISSEDITNTSKTTGVSKVEKVVFNIDEQAILKKNVDSPRGSQEDP